jgi:hypothetical protein
MKTLFPEQVKEFIQLDRKSVNQIFLQINELNIKDVEFSHPGNLTYTIALKHWDEYYEIKWGDPGFQVPGNVKTCYQFIMEKINQK